MTIIKILFALGAVHAGNVSSPHVDVCSRAISLIERPAPQVGGV